MNPAAEPSPKENDPAPQPRLTSEGRSIRSRFLINLAVWVGLAVLALLHRVWLGRGDALYMTVLLVAIGFTAVSIWDLLSRR